MNPPTQITRKKTLRIKRPQSAATKDVPAEGAPSPGDDVKAGGVSSVAPSAPPAAQGQAPAVDAGTKTTIIVAALASVCFLVLLALQWGEWSFYKRPPTSWPRISLQTVAPEALPTVPVEPGQPVPDQPPAQPAAQGGAPAGAPTNPLVMAGLGVTGLVCVVCWIVTLVKIFKSSVGLGILGLVCGLFAFVYGWVKVKEHNNKVVMILWSVAMVIQLVLPLLGGMALITSLLPG
jgi:hypothetical protein